MDKSIFSTSQTAVVQFHPFKTDGGWNNLGESSTKNLDSGSLDKRRLLQLLYDAPCIYYSVVLTLERFARSTATAG